jgi:hypothetical protein
MVTCTYEVGIVIRFKIKYVRYLINTTYDDK